MLRFQSVGDNCEFGIVQRCCSCEPLGLFRFVNSAIPELIAGLDEDFRSYGTTGDLEIHAGQDLYWCNSRRHRFAHSTGQRIGTAEPEQVLRREYTKVAFLKRSMLEELSEGHKIFVRKGSPSESLDEFLSLAAAIRRHGPSTVLRVEAAPSSEWVGRVNWHSPGIMVGYVRRFSPYEGGMDIDLEPWVELCRNAYALALGISRLQAPTEGACVRIRGDRKAFRHATRSRANRLSTFASRVDAAPSAVGTITLFSAWVWVPRAFRGDRIFGFIKIFDNYERLAGTDANLALRDAWQRIWVSARLPSQPALLAVGLAAVGEGSQRFWSTDWRLSEDPFPPHAPPPTLPIGPSIWERLFG